MVGARVAEDAARTRLALSGAAMAVTHPAWLAVTLVAAALWRSLRRARDPSRQGVKERSRGARLAPRSLADAQARATLARGV